MREVGNFNNSFENVRLAPFENGGGLSDANLPGGARPELEAVKMADLDWSQAVAVKGIGFRILIPVPDLGSESQVHTIKNWKGEDVEVTGFKFRNLTDSADQAVTGDGKGVIILAVDPEKTDIKATTNAIFDKILELGGVENLNTTKLDALLNYIRTELAVNDMYDSNDSIAESMAAQVGLTAEGQRPFGLFEKIDKPGPVAIYVDRPAIVLDGPHAGTASYPNGFLAVRIPPKKEGGEPSYRSIAPEAIHYCYKSSDGKPLQF